MNKYIIASIILFFTINICFAQTDDGKGYKKEVSVTKAYKPKIMNAD